MKDNAKRDMILKAAKECFRDKGYYGSGIDEIAKRAGITKSLLYYYFKSKDDIFIALLEESLDRILNRLNESYSSDIKKNFESLLENIRSESDVLSVGLVDLFMEDNKTDMILKLSRLNFSDSQLKAQINEKNIFLYVMFIIRAVCFFSLSKKVCSHFGIAEDRAEELNKEELFLLYKKIHNFGGKL